MRSILAFVFVSYVDPASAFAVPRSQKLLEPVSSTRPLPASSTSKHHHLTRASLFRPSSMERFLDKVFDQADSNQDGTVDIAETYEMVLQLYLKLNRQAPIPPPSRATVLALFRDCDADGDNRISREEFSRLAQIVGSRAVFRLVAHKLVTLLCAPLMAEYALRKLMGRKTLHKMAERIVPERFLGSVCSVTFWRTVLIVLFVASMGNVVLGIVNFLLDINVRAQQEIADQKKRFWQRRRTSSNK